MTPHARTTRARKALDAYEQGLNCAVEVLNDLEPDALPEIRETIYRGAHGTGEGVMVELTEQQFAALFRPYPKVATTEAGMPTCPYCHHPLSPNNLEYYTGATEAGTTYTDVEIECDACNRVIWRGGSWYPGVDSPDELMTAATDMLEEAIGEQP